MLTDTQIDNVLAMLNGEVLTQKAATDLRSALDGERTPASHAMAIGMIKDVSDALGCDGDATISDLIEVARGYRYHSIALHTIFALVHRDLDARDLGPFPHDAIRESVEETVGRVALLVLALNGAADALAKTPGTRAQTDLTAMAAAVGAGHSAAGNGGVSND